VHYLQGSERVKEGRERTCSLPSLSQHLRQDLILAFLPHCLKIFERLEPPCYCYCYYKSVSVNVRLTMIEKAEHVKLVNNSATACLHDS
jgi:hypothetical protein